MKKEYLRYLIVPSFAIVLYASFFVGDIYAQTFDNPIGYGNVNDFLGAVLVGVQNIVAALAVLMIVVGGILYITSGGDSGRVELAKKAVTAALIGLALALAAPAFLSEIFQITESDVNNPVTATKSLSDIIISTIKVASGLVGALSVLMLVVGGIMYMVSGGDSTRADTAKNIIKYAIIGLIIAIMALIIVTQVVNVVQ